MDFSNSLVIGSLSKNNLEDFLSTETACRNNLPFEKVIRSTGKASKTSFAIKIPLILFPSISSKPFHKISIPKLRNSFNFIFCFSIIPLLGSIITKETPSEELLLLSNKYFISPVKKLPSPAPKSMMNNF